MTGFDLTHSATSRVERDGFTLTATAHPDPDHAPPWEEYDGHGIVSDWTTREPNEGERILSRDRGKWGAARYYDFAATVELARKDGWGPGTPEEAAEADFARLRDWCNDNWWYVGVAVTVERLGVPLTGPYDHALWGIESDARAYLAQVAEDLSGEALKAAKAKLAQLCEGITA